MCAQKPEVSPGHWMACDNNFYATLARVSPSLGTNSEHRYKQQPGRLILPAMVNSPRTPKRKRLAISVSTSHVEREWSTHRAASSTPEHPHKRAHANPTSTEASGTSDGLHTTSGATEEIEGEEVSGATSAESGAKANNTIVRVTVETHKRILTCRRLIATVGAHARLHTRVGIGRVECHSSARSGPQGACELRTLWPLAKRR